MSSQLAIITLLFLFPASLAHVDAPKELVAPHMESEMMMMTPYFHWMANADALYFKAWVPRTPGALVGACFGLFFLAIFERFLGSAKGLLEAWWRRR